MEVVRRLLCFGIGFLFSMSLVILDDRMGFQYGYDPDRDVDREVREVISSFQGMNFGVNDQVEERPSLEVFVTQKM